MANTGTGVSAAGKAYYDPAFPTDGLFWFDSAVRLTDVTDGTSNTLLLAESLRGSSANLTGVPLASLPKPYRVAANLTAGLSRVGTAPGGVSPMWAEADAQAATAWQANRGYQWIWGQPSVEGRRPHTDPRPRPSLARQPATCSP